MNVGDFCMREVVVARGDESVAAGARLMREHHVGDLVLTEERNRVQVPVGIVTDRDLVVEVMADGVAGEAVRLADVVTGGFFTVHEEDSLFDALEIMRSHGVRRVPVVDFDGGLAGIITADDVIALLAEILDDLADLVEREGAAERARRPARN